MLNFATLSLGTYMLGRLWYGRVCGVAGAFLLSFSTKMAEHAQLISPDLLSMSLLVWVAVLATLLSRCTSRIWLIVLTSLIAISPFIRAENPIYCVILLLAVFGLKKVKEQVLLLAVPATLMWGLYLIWFFVSSGTVPFTGRTEESPQAIHQLEKWIQVVLSHLRTLDWLLILLAAIFAALLKKARYARLLGVPGLLVLANGIVITFTAPDTFTLFRT